MKYAPAISAALSQDHSIRAVPVVTIDWNMNRYYSVVAENTPLEEDEGFHPDLFPIESICEPNRPTKGINKLRVGGGTVAAGYTGETPIVVQSRFYVADADDTYKYWTSPVPSDALGTLTKTKPQVVYSQNVSVNKIVITLENTWASPKTFQIQTTTVAAPTNSDWTSVPSANIGTAWKSTGQIVLYYNGSVWLSGARVDNEDKSPKTATIRGVRVVVTELEGGYQKTNDGSTVSTTYEEAASNGTYTTKTTNGKDAFFDLIEISARLEMDLSPYVISVEDTFDMGEKSNFYPMGTVTANVGSLTLSNLYRDASGEWVPGLFSADNAASKYRDFVEANATVTLGYKYFDEDEFHLGTVNQFVMYTNTWTGQSTDEVSVNLDDYSKFFDSADMKLRAAMWEGLSVSQILVRILDSVGFVNHNIDFDEDKVTDHVIPVFYTDGESTVWEVVDELAKATQSAIYFDGKGKLQIKTRNFAFSPDAESVADLSSTSANGILANIVSAEVETEYEVNHYTVKYSKTNWSDVTRGAPTLEVVWQPDSESVVLRATPLLRTLDFGDPFFWMAPADIRYWPYKGKVNIQGELISFNGKRFIYYTSTAESSKKAMVINSQDEFEKRNARTPPSVRHKNHFDGGMKIEERGVWNSEPKRHPVEAEGYSVRQIVKNNHSTNAAGFRHYKQYSRVELKSTGYMSTGADLKLATRGAGVDTPFYNYGTRMRFLKETGRTGQRAGIVIHNNTLKEDGYYIEFTPSKNVNGKKKSRNQEFVLYRREDGSQKILDSARCAIGENIDYEVDVRYAAVDGDHRLQVWLNGKMISAVTVSGTDKITPTGKFGMFIRGKTRAEWEYLYAISREEESDLPEDFSFLDKVERGYMGGQWDREWVYGWRDRKRRPIKKWRKGAMRYNRTFFDEFGPIIHEIREFDIKFDPSPAQHSRLYLTNDWAACCLEYHASPYGAKFVLANTSRRNAVIHGEDKLSFSGTDNGISQRLNVFGRTLVTGDDEEVVAKNDLQIRRRGKNESELTSPWIQSESMANEVANWMNDHFSYGNDNITVEVFGNPLIEIADVVTVNYAERHIVGEFFVTGISTAFDAGVTTSLTLRRRVV